MEIVSRKVANIPLSPSTRIERREPGAPQSPRPRWNGGSSSSSVGKSPGAALPSGNSLLSLKAYYRKLRTFKGTVKALINLRRFPTSKGTDDSAIESTLSAAANDARRVASSVARIATDGASLIELQSQVHSLVNDGHVITEIDRSMAGEVSYRHQGNLDHYTEENLMKRIALQKHPHMVALTQRLWMCAIHADGSTTNNTANSNGSDAVLTFTSYESFMLRLHRLILPEFDIAASRELIHDDWMRDTNGVDHLDYAYFHLSMFELVDLWTDTVINEDYISLLYCIMHSLTFAWGEHRLLKPLEDINPVDILEESKGVTLEDIATDLIPELNSAAASSFRELIVCSTPRDAQNLSGVSGCANENEGTSESARSVSAGTDTTGKIMSASQPGLRTKDTSHLSASDAKDNARGAPSKSGKDTSSIAATLGSPVEATLTRKIKGGISDSELEDNVSTNRSGAERRRSSGSGSRAKSASSVAARRASALQRHAAANSKLRVLSSSGEYSPHVIYDGSGRFIDQDLSASPLTVKAYAQQLTGEHGQSQRERGFSLELKKGDQMNGGLMGISGLQNLSIKPKSAVPRSYVAARSLETNGHEFSYPTEVQSSSLYGATISAKAEGTRIASFTYEGASPRPPPLQIGSLGLDDPKYSMALKPTTYTLLASSDSPRPRSSVSGSSVAAASPRAASASYKRQRQPSTESTVHRPAGNPSLMVANSPRSKLNIYDVDIDVSRDARASPVGSPRHASSTLNPAFQGDLIQITGLAATPRGAHHGSVAALYASLARQPTIRGVADFSPLVITGQEHDTRSQRAEDTTRQRRASTKAPPQSTKLPLNLLDKPMPNQASVSSPASRRVSAAKLRHQSSRRVPMGSRPGSSRQFAHPADFSVHSLGLSSAAPASSQMAI